MTGKQAATEAQLREWIIWYADHLQEEATKHTQTKEELKQVKQMMFREREAKERLSGELKEVREDYDDLKEDYDDLKRKFDNFVRDSGTTMYPCPECGRGMNSREGCLRCHVDRLKKALARRPNWQPISKAPENKSVLVYDGEAIPPIAVAFYTSSGWELEWGEPGETDVFTPSHWMYIEDLL